MLAQDYPNFEIILVNDGSKSPKVAENLGLFSDPRLHIVHQENQGFVRTIRRAIELSKGQFIAVMGAGDVCEPSRLRKQFEFFLSNPDLAIVGCQYTKLHTGEKNDEIFSPIAPRRGAIGHFSFSHGELMYRRSVYDDVGGYDVDFPVGQGSELWMRMMRTHDAAIVPEILYHQIVYDDGVSKDPERIVRRNNLVQFRQNLEMSKRVGPWLESWFTSRYSVDDVEPIRPLDRAIVEFFYLAVCRQFRIPLFRRLQLRRGLRKDTGGKLFSNEKAGFLNA